PTGWPHRLASRLRGVVLAGFTAFSPADAMIAGRRLLELGPVRIKPAHLLGGVGQAIADDAASLEAAVEALDAEMLHSHGVVLEQNIESPQVFSIGELCVGDLTVAYHGTQREVANHAGDAVYGGSDLQFVRGRMAGLLQLCLEPSLRRAVEQAHAY